MCLLSIALFVLFVLILVKTANIPHFKERFTPEEYPLSAKARARGNNGENLPIIPEAFVYNNNKLTPLYPGYSSQGFVTPGNLGDPQRISMIDGPWRAEK